MSLTRHMALKRLSLCLTATATIALACVGTAASQTVMSDGLTRAERERILGQLRTQGFIGGEIRRSESGVRIHTRFERSPTNYDTSTVNQDETSYDPGFDAGVYVPLFEGDGGLLGDESGLYFGAWGAPTTQFHFIDQQTYAPGDTANTYFDFSPNVFSAFIGYIKYWDFISFLGGVETPFSLGSRVYGGARVSDYDLRVDGLAPNAYSYTKSNYVVVPAGGFDLSINVDLSNRVDRDYGSFRVGAYAGWQIQGGFDVSAQGAGTGATIYTDIDVDPTQTAYVGGRAALGVGRATCSAQIHLAESATSDGSIF